MGWNEQIGDSEYFSCFVVHRKIRLNRGVLWGLGQPPGAQ